MYSYCTSVQTANINLSQTTLDLYRILAAVNSNNYNSSEDNEMSINDYDETEEWCIV